MRGDVRSPHAPETVTRFVPHRLVLVVEQANEPIGAGGAETDGFEIRGCNGGGRRAIVSTGFQQIIGERSEEHTSELQSLMRNSYAVFCLKKKKENQCNQNKKHYQQISQYRTRHNNERI